MIVAAVDGIGGILRENVTLKDLFRESTLVLDGLSQPIITRVPKYPALTRDQFNCWSKFWPMKFHENKRLEISIL